jgi:hypothetical protein
MKGINPSRYIINTYVNITMCLLIQLIKSLVYADKIIEKDL